MLPRKVPNWLLVVLCVGSVGLYLLIKLWLINLPPLFIGADVVADVMMTVLVSFFTAFPFWWVIEWFQRRQRTLEVSVQQRFIIDNLTIQWNLSLIHI